MKAVYYPKGVCSRKIEIEIENDVVKKIKFTGGCNGNLQGISKLVVGRSADEVVELLTGIKCGMKNTSCPDQLAAAIREMQQEKPKDEV